MSKNAVCQKSLEFYHTSLVGLLKKVGVRVKKWSKASEFGVNENSAEGSVISAENIASIFSYHV